MTCACLGIGIASAHAEALGPAWVLHRGDDEIQPRRIAPAEVESEARRFRRAVDTARQRLQRIRARIPEGTPADIAEFIDAHILMLGDAAIAEAPQELIRERLFAAEWALQVKRDALLQVFDEMEDPYLRTRKDDLEHVVREIQKALLGDEGNGLDQDLDGRIVIAIDLAPADTILLHDRGAAAFVTEYGGPMSHTAILARSLGIPAVVGVRHATRYLRAEETLIVDGGQGVVLAHPDSLVLDHYQHRLEQARAHHAVLRRLLARPSRTRDGVNVELLANVEMPGDLERARDSGARGVGLYRTEFLYMNRERPPDEEEHLAAYRAILEGAEGLPVTIRTLDLGADKGLEGGEIRCPPAYNPALGLRAIRLCLKEPELFRPQLRAMLRAAAEGPLRIMLPMLSQVNEVLSVRRLLEQLRGELHRDGLDFAPQVPLGGMIEVPAAALSAPLFARHLDFLSIGTNDLIQYTLAIDRTDDEVNYLFDPLHPAVLRLIHLTIQAGQAHAIPVSMCGEMAGDAHYTRLLLGLGLRQFSMEPHGLLEVKEQVMASNAAELHHLAQRLVAGLDREDYRRHLEPLLQTAS